MNATIPTIPSLPSFSAQASSQTPEEMQVSETRYRRLFEAARDGILILDAVTCKITDVNPFLIELLGYSRAELLGKELFEIGLLKDAAASQDMYQELQKTGYIRYDDLPLVTKGGQRREVEFVSNVYEENGKQVIQCNIRDITQRKQIVAALRESEERYQSIVSNVPGMVYQFALHPDSSVSWPFIGPGCRELFEAEPETLQNDPVWPRTQIHPDDLGTYDSSRAASAATLLNDSGSFD